MSDLELIIDIFLYAALPVAIAVNIIRYRHLL